MASDAALVWLDDDRLVVELEGRLLVKSRAGDVLAEAPTPLDVCSVSVYGISTTPEILTVTPSGELEARDAALRLVRAHGIGRGHDVRLSPLGSRVAVLDGMRTRVVDTQTGVELGNLFLGDGTVADDAWGAIAVADDGRVAWSYATQPVFSGLGSMGAEGRRLCVARADSPVETLSRFDEGRFVAEPSRVIVSPNGAHVAVALPPRLDARSLETGPRVLAVPPEPLPMPKVYCEGRVRSMVFAPTSDGFACATDRSLHLVRLGEAEGTLVLDREAVSIAFSPDGLEVAVLYRDGSISVHLAYAIL